MFFGKEFKDPVTYKNHADATAATAWVQNRVPNRTVFIVTDTDTGEYYIMMRELRPQVFTNLPKIFLHTVVNKGFMLALMARHDCPPDLREYEDRDGKLRMRDTARVPFMDAIPYLDVLPRERFA